MHENLLRLLNFSSRNVHSAQRRREGAYIAFYLSLVRL